MDSHIGILNYGVGNYGVDQALLAYKNKKLPESIEVTIMCFVPETISRVHSYWKHYLEFGNTLAFKPRFILQNNDLVLVDNLISTKNDLQNIKTTAEKAKKIDFFMKENLNH